jgi:hypothetical protein
MNTLYLILCSIAAFIITYFVGIIHGKRKVEQKEQLQFAKNIMENKKDDEKRANDSIDVVRKRLLDNASKD